MRKRSEELGPSCWTSALDEEMMFILLARDSAAPAAIRAWAKERIRTGLNEEGDAKIVDALKCADIMEREHSESLRLAYIDKHGLPVPEKVTP